MPGPDEVKWTYQRACAYRLQRREIGGVAGVADEFLRPNKAGVLPTGAARERYDRRVAKTGPKLAGMPTPEAKSDLTTQKVTKDIAFAKANVDQMIKDLGNYIAY